MSADVDYYVPESMQGSGVIYADPAPVEDGRQRQARLRPNLAGCTDAEKRAYLSIEVGGLTAEEFANAEGKSPSTVRSQLRNAREKVEANTGGSE